jgi:hypothetical protein
MGAVHPPPAGALILVRFDATRRAGPSAGGASFGDPDCFLARPADDFESLSTWLKYPERREGIFATSPGDDSRAQMSTLATARTTWAGPIGGGGLYFSVLN